ncbi:MAG: DUF7557 family protein [Candidatus Binatia bacterium]
METTIKVKRTTKAELDQLRKDGETYDEAIARLMKRERIERELKEAYRKNAKFDLEICKEWEKIDADDSGVRPFFFPFYSEVTRRGRRRYGEA